MIDDRVLTTHERRISEKVRFYMRLRGLIFYGALEQWGIVTEEDYHTLLDHSTPIKKHEHHILARKIGSLSATDLYVTGKILEHFPDEYVVADNRYYYYLGERTLTHKNIYLERSPRRNPNQEYIYRLIDKGSSGHNLVMVRSMTLSESADFTDSELDMYIRDHMLSEYKQEIRRAS